jgi:transcriptional regulator with XRE-family HTH domain
MSYSTYTNWPAMSDKYLMQHIGKFIKHHRMEQNKTQDALALAAGISRSTLSLLERGETVNLMSLIQVLRILDQLQVLDAFTVVKTISPLALLQEAKSKRYRVRAKKTT